MKTNYFFIIMLIFVLSLTTFSVKIWALEISVVDVRRNISLADDDVIYKDFYVNAGEGSALRKNMVVNVKRKINIKDVGAKSVGDFETVVGQLKIIQIGNKVSVGREYKLIPRDEEAMLEQIGIMSGDRLELTGSFIDNTKPNYHRKNTEADPLIKSAEESKTVNVESPSLIAPTLPILETPTARDPANNKNEVVPTTNQQQLTAPPTATPLI